MRKLMLFSSLVICTIFLSCQSNTDKEPSGEPYPNYDTNKNAGRVNKPDPDSVKSIGSPADDQHFK